GAVRVACLVGVYARQSAVRRRVSCRGRAHQVLGVVHRAAARASSRAARRVPGPAAAGAGSLALAWSAGDRAHVADGAALAEELYLVRGSRLSHAVQAPEGAALERGRRVPVSGHGGGGSAF